MSTTPGVTDIFQFMELRAPFLPDTKALRQNYIRDDLFRIVNGRPERVDADIHSEKSLSTVGKIVYNHVFCEKNEITNRAERRSNNSRLLASLLHLLKPYKPVSPSEPPGKGINPLSITELERRAHINFEGAFYFLPEHLEHIDGLKMQRELLCSLEAMGKAKGNFNLSQLVKKLESVFGGKNLRNVVFYEGFHSEEFISTKRKLFDTLYLLYVLRRFAPANLEYVIEGLRALHVIEALAVDDLIAAAKAGHLSASDAALKTTLEAIFPELHGWNGSGALATLPLIKTKAGFEAYFTATPVIHPIFARLEWYKSRFNDIKPIGIGDLKVVKQWLSAYLPGEISHIENVLKGEIKDRMHRQLEKTEESYSFSSDSKESTQKDTQTTDRFELKKEIDNVVKTELNVGANASLTYKGNPVITASASGSFGYRRDTADQGKISDMFWRETVTKAIEQAEKSVSEKRSMSKYFETEETNKHGFDNTRGTGHVSGVYRWVDKKYKAQLFNYGKRMMFEFMIPEPAAFFVESRLRSYESALNCPQPPQPPVEKSASLDFTPTDILEPKFQNLRQKYDLSEFVFPLVTRKVEFLNPTTGDNLFKEKDIGGSTWFAKTYNCKINAKGYRLTNLTVTGYLDFWGDGEKDAWEENTFEVSVNGQTLARIKNESINNHWVWNPGPVFTVTPELILDDDVALTIGSMDLNHQYLSVRGTISISAQALLDWQTKVFNKVKGVEQQKVDRENQEARTSYKSSLSEYRNRIAELKARAINDLLQGQSEAFNRRIILTELKKHCLSMLTREFDADGSDDLLSEVDTVQGRPVDFTFRKFNVREGDAVNTAICSFETRSETVEYPSIVLEQAKWKSGFIQFLEQAFEWPQLAYIFHPYFWSAMPKWIELMNRSDEADPNMTAFLQAGSVKVVLAVTPAYEDAVLHFLATREPWNGGTAPVIGDPLYIPLYEELRKSQDDRYNAVPEGEPWTFILPTSLVYLEDSGVTLPQFPDPPTP
ncbi:MAG: hypothetical protein HZB85_03980 [Deltaproteobacteria bacterium]|nr:hypothetical protein [Deltaproteobacteria bacterium]